MAKKKKNIINNKNNNNRTAIDYASHFRQPNEQSISFRPRIGSICKLYNVGDSTLIEFLTEKGYENLNIHSSLSGDALKLIENEFIGFKDQKDKIRGKTEVNFIANKSIQNSVKLTSEMQLGVYESEPILLLKNNLFQKPQKKIRFPNLPELISNFTDNEAIDICSKMTSSFSRNLCSELNTSTSKRDLILYQLHFIANKALKIFGGNVLTFIHQLRKLRFKNRTANEIKTYKKVVPDFPILSFKYSHSDSLKISFFLKQTKNGIRPDMRIFSSKTFDEIGHLDESGYIFTKLEKFRPQLSMFCSAQQKNQLELFAGVENGYCDLCGKELTHPNSLRIGLGPVCARNKKIDLDSLLYDFN